MSRNRDRAGAHQPTDASPPNPGLMESGTFSFVVPTEFVELPSEGRFYPPHHPLHGQSSIEIKQMTAKEEDILTSRTLLKKGIAIDRLLQSLIVDKSISADDILIGDRNAIIIATRVSGYGNDYKTAVACPRCTATAEKVFDLNKAFIHKGGADGSDNVQYNDDGTFSTVLPTTGVTVAFRLLTGADERRMLNGIESDRKQKSHEKNITRQILNIVCSVNGDSSSAALNYLVQNIPSSDSRHLRLTYRKIAPNIDLTQDFECGECGYETEMEVPLSADFFWPDR